jgi:dTDP-4-amino-4,6-dideoxygalactose transaminase
MTDGSSVTDWRASRDGGCDGGGSSRLSMPTRGEWPHFDPEEIEAVEAVLRSGRVNYWTGEQGRLFEGEFAKACGCAYGVAVANGTLALELALRALEIGPGHEVVVTPRSFIASASTAVICGAKPVFADVDPVSQNLTAETIEAVLTPRTRAIIAVHLAGWPCDLQPILELARRRGIALIEDCAQAHGATYNGGPIGSFGDVAAFSFCQDKIMTTGGEGGLVLTNDRRLWQRAWAYKDHGKDYDVVHHRVHPPGFRWLHESFGSNWRLTEMQAAIGRAQLRKLPRWLERRRRSADMLTDFFQTQPALRVTKPPPHVGHAYYKYYAFVRPERLKPGWDRDRIVAAVVAESVPCFSGSCSEIYHEKAFVRAAIGPAAALPVAKVLGDTSLMFLVHPTLGDEDMVRTCRAVEKVLAEATDERRESATAIAAGYLWRGSTERAPALTRRTNPL